MTPFHPDIVIHVHDARWKQSIGDLESFVPDVMAHALRQSWQGSGGAAVSVVLTGDREIQKLNREFRHQDKPTNVLSFPCGEPSGNGDVELGDIVLAFETVSEEAVAQNKPLKHHLAHLLIHGTLHLLGHDHENDADADIMEAKEKELLAAMGIDDPYLPRRNSDGAP